MSDSFVSLSIFHQTHNAGRGVHMVLNFVDPISSFTAWGSAKFGVNAVQDGDIVTMEH